jgi:hypothetical protein
VWGRNGRRSSTRSEGSKTQRIPGGTGAFRHAAGSFAGTLRGRGVAARNPDGTCSQQMAQLLEVAIFSMRGTLSV